MGKHLDNDISTWHLLNCPFCGAKERRKDDDAPGPTLKVFGVLPDAHIRCDVCGASTDEFASRRDAVAAWNRRTK